MRHHRDDVVRHALGVLDTYGLADLTMRRLAGDLDVRPSALYHHFRDKQSLLAAVADEVLRRGARPVSATAWDEQVVEICSGLRDALLAYRDGAELVSTVIAFGLGASQPYDDLVAALAPARLGEDLAATAARTLLHLVLGHTLDEQTHLQAGSAGAIGDGPRPRSDFAAGLGLVVDGIRLRAATGTSDRLDQRA
ncbi:putative transcriptional regulator, TetR family protein [Nocardioides sp. OK12]|uniref:AcrR family transcriptional regulator n=1 Tax=Nocardioides marinisabuli TaxID=419476 RepID=A0A7Y9F275_9ACTN|nr:MULTISPECIES: TetR/AcrR family transcriptional regulator C-terminal domain-containing protein [Nocardioides]NYD58273.1 AcrR family transcriptional regulator [Nocardioides marinisabuli]GHJ57949.1 putative transcriptional regulator, TetR family protein [Nocardioides sp. OK12]